MSDATEATGQYRLYGYRWVVLALTMGVNLTMQMLWIAYASITSEAAPGPSSVGANTTCTWPAIKSVTAGAPPL